MMPCWNTGPNMPGKMVTTSNLISVAFSCVLDVEQPVGHDDPAPRDVDLDDGVLGGRDQLLDRALPADPHVVGRTLQDLRDPAPPLARLRQHGQAPHLPHVEAPYL